MEHDELAAIALRYDTVVSNAMLRALGVDRTTRSCGKTSAKVDKFAGAKRLMRQRYGVRL